jgi:hypothetical protein
MTGSESPLPDRHREVSSQLSKAMAAREAPPIGKRRVPLPGPASSG